MLNKNYIYNSKILKIPINVVFITKSSEPTYFGVRLSLNNVIQHIPYIVNLDNPSDNETFKNIDRNKNFK